eukprot:1630915-Amphidinium_carterae.1
MMWFCASLATRSSASSWLSYQHSLASDKGKEWQPKLAITTTAENNDSTKPHLTHRGGAAKSRRCHPKSPHSPAFMQERAIQPHWGLLFEPQTCDEGTIKALHVHNQQTSLRTANHSMKPNNHERHFCVRRDGMRFTTTSNTHPTHTTTIIQSQMCPLLQQRVSCSNTNCCCTSVSSHYLHRVVQPQGAMWQLNLGSTESRH